MTLGGRPREEAGHKGVKLSLNKKCREILAEAQSKGQTMSKLVEDAILAKAYHQVDRPVQPEPVSYVGLIDHRISVKVNYKLDLHECMSIAESASLT